jgi:hypothetical protein
MAETQFPFATFPAATDSAAALHNLIGEDVIAAFEQDASFLASSEPVRLRDTDDIEDGDEEEDEDIDDDEDEDEDEDSDEDEEDDDDEDDGDVLRTAESNDLHEPGARGERLA